ncbi:hypothetical protein QJS66_19075 [Kocuria rhizophila]|nr:hypothetical protein QJS66_19075 [Kocuria rhizophila]
MPTHTVPRCAPRTSPPRASHSRCGVARVVRAWPCRTRCRPGPRGRRSRADPGWVQWTAAPRIRILLRLPARAIPLGRALLDGASLVARTAAEVIARGVQQRPRARRGHPGPGARSALLPRWRRRGGAAVEAGG